MDERRIERGIDAAADKAKNAAAQTVRAAEKTGGKMREQVRQTNDAVHENAEKAGDKLRETGSKIKDATREGVLKAADKAEQVVSSAAERIREKLG